MSPLPIQSPIELPSLQELLDSMHVVQLPMRTRFRGITTREAALWEGPNGWTEWSPFLEYAPAEAARWLAATLEHGWGKVPAPKRKEIPVNGTIPALEPHEIPAILKRFDGYSTFKVKVAEPGQTLSDDLARLDVIRTELGDTVHLRVDANGHWTIDQALTAAEVFGPYHLEYLEQPVATVDDMAKLRTRLAGAVKIAADENIRKASDPDAVRRAGAADVMIIKAQPLGGATQATQVMRKVRLPAVVSSALDTSIGLYWGARLASTLPELPYACGLATSRLFVDDVAEFTPDRGVLAIPPTPPTPDNLNAHLAPADRMQWWRQRLELAYAELSY